jgi:DNA polymerase III delta subunit
VERRITPQSFEAQIASGRIEPVYVLVGPDVALKAKLVALLVDTVEEDLRPFNVDKLFPSDHREEARKQFWTVLQLSRTLPMMAPRRVIVVAQAENLLPVFKTEHDEAPGRPDEAPAGRKGRKAVLKAAGEAELEALEEYLTSPSPESVLVLVAGDGLNRNLRPVKLLEKLAAMVDWIPCRGAATPSRG